MTTHPLTLPSNKADLLFDDRSLLESAFGKNALKRLSANTNCDCDGYNANQNDEDFNTHPITATAAASC